MRVIGAAASRPDSGAVRGHRHRHRHRGRAHSRPVPGLRAGRLAPAEAPARHRPRPVAGAQVRARCSAATSASQSEVGEGSRFSVTLPVKIAAPRSAGGHAVSPDAHAPGPQPREDPRRRRQRGDAVRDRAHPQAGGLRRDRGGHRHEALAAAEHADSASSSSTSTCRTSTASRCAGGCARAADRLSAGRAPLGDVRRTRST